MTKFQNEAIFVARQYTSTVDGCDAFTKSIFHLTDEILCLMTGPLKAQVVSCVEKCKDLIDRPIQKLPKEFLQQDGHPVQCPVITCSAVVVSLRDVYQDWRICSKDASVIAPDPLLGLFRSIACDLGICMQPPFTVQLNKDGENWMDLPFMNQLLVAFKIMRLCFRKHGKELAVVMDESCVLVITLESNGLLKFSANDGYGVRMVINEPSFDFGLPLHLQEIGAADA